MKQVKSIFLTALAALAFAACNDDEVTDPGNPGEVISGKETYVSFNFQVAGDRTNTRAAMETDQNKTETAPTDGRILIFDDASGALLNNEPLQTGGMTIKTTSGVRRIYVIMGTGDTGEAVPENKSQMNTRLDALKTTGPNISTLSDFYALMTDEKYTGTSEEDLDMGKGFKELMESAKYTVSNVADINAVKTLHPGIGKDQSATGGTGGTGVEDETVNRFQFDVFRAVAKGRVLVKLRNETELQTADHIFKLKADATYGVRNVNRCTYYVQRFLNDKVQANLHDHDSESGLLPFSAFHNVFDESTPEQLKDLNNYKPYYFKGYPIAGNEAQKITMVARDGTPTIPANSVYFSENSNNKQVHGNTTYYGIATQVNSIDGDNIAKSISFEGSTGQITSVADVAYDNSLGDKSFWYIRELPPNIDDMLKGTKRRVFTDKAVAFEAVTILLKYAQNPTFLLDTDGFNNQTFASSALMASYDQAVNPQASSGVTPLTPHDVNLVDRFLGYYKNGISYYRLNLYETTSETHTQRHLVRRNHNYVATVTSFATIGDPTEGDLDKDPEKPVDADVTNVTAIINVIGWHDITMEDDL